MLISELDQRIAAVCPIDGIDSSGGISFKPAATASQREAAQALMDTHLGEMALPIDAGGQPRIVTMRQARLALLQAGLLTSVNAALAGATGAAGEAARIEWEYAATVDRDSPLVVGLVATLKLTAEQLDALFAAAAVL